MGIVERLVLGHSLSQLFQASTPIITPLVRVLAFSEPNSVSSQLLLSPEVNVLTLLRVSLISSWLDHANEGPCSSGMDVDKREKLLIAS